MGTKSGGVYDIVQYRGTKATLTRELIKKFPKSEENMAVKLHILIV